MKSQILLGFQIENMNLVFSALILSELKKKLTDKIDLSISSTLGGSLDPTQEMNLDLKIDSNISLEGVYEIKSSTESDGESSNSAGADLKFQWSFK